MAECISFSSDEGNAEDCPSEECDGGGEDLFWWDEDELPRSANHDYPAVPDNGGHYPSNGN